MNFDPDGLKLQRLIEKRRKELGITPSCWRKILTRLGQMVASIVWSVL
ncbi:MAG: hypothetical protein ACP5I8_11535 [Phycisphaerae bacterium]